MVQSRASLILWWTDEGSDSVELFRNSSVTYSLKRFLLSSLGMCFLTDLRSCLYTLTACNASEQLILQSNPYFSPSSCITIQLHFHHTNKKKRKKLQKNCNIAKTKTPFYQTFNPHPLRINNSKNNRSFEFLFQSQIKTKIQFHSVNLT